MDYETRVSPFSVLKLMLSKNGLIWSAHVIPYILIRKIFKDVRFPALDIRIKNIERKYNLPGINCAEINKAIWNTWTWEKEYGDEWTWSEGWKQSLISDVILKNIQPGKSVLEIGPGAGRWSSTLQKISKRLVLVDISEECIRKCRQLFFNYDNVSYFVNNGSDLNFIKNDSIDYIWSFDVFVHITPADTALYLNEFQRILKKGGRGIIHHAKDGGIHGGWRSNMTDTIFADLLNKSGLSLISQFDCWGEDGRYDVKYYHDTLSIFEK